ncbi:MAG: pyridoxal kinase [Rubrimonas sp.]|uniref:pyridoxal kinase n=1 Tax=Rubrimonas sp. TaxID=2036015 RepID=UPI002FDE825D
MPAVLSIQSQVVWGSVGAQAATFPLQRLGFDVWALPTTLLSAHAATPGMRGRRLPAAEISALGEGVRAHGGLAQVAAVLLGYLGSAEAASVAFDLAEACAAPALRFLDPVLGDDGPGLYLPEAVGEAYLARGLKIAQVAAPNRFELGWLTGRDVATLEGCVAAAQALRAMGPATVFVTSAPASPGATGVLAVDGAGAWLAETPLVPHRAAGAGDMCSALLLAHLLDGAASAEAAARAAASVGAVVAEAARAGAAFLPIVAAQARWLSPERAAQLRRVG